MADLCYKLMGEEDLHGFDCGNPSVSNMIDQTYYACLLREARAYCVYLKVKDDQEILVGAYSVSIDTLDVKMQFHHLRITTPVNHPSVLWSISTTLLLIQKCRIMVLEQRFWSILYFRHGRCIENGRFDSWSWMRCGIRLLGMKKGDFQLSTRMTRTRTVRQ